jgi:HK97 family phage major capsid protein/HK97 family phage prohead protease
MMMANYKGEDIDLKPTEAMAEEAQKGLDWRKEFGRGGTEVGVARARQLVNRQEVSAETVRRMHSYFSRHEVDKEGEGFSPGEDGYPSAGRIAWALWGGDVGQSWARNKDRQLDKIDEEATRAIEDEFPDKTITALENKVEEHNEEHGSAKSKRVTLGMLAKVYKRGVGAYNTNPQSVRPSVSSEEQWAMARVNSFLFAVRNGKYRSGKHDTDLLPEGHPMKTEDERKEANLTISENYVTFLKENERGADMENRHVVEVDETEDTVTVVFAKHKETPSEEMSEEITEDKMDQEEEKMEMEDERKEPISLDYRAIDLDDKTIDEESRTVRVGVSSEEPVKRQFGMEVMDHTKENMNLEFLNSGRAPLLLDHDMEKQIGVVESVELDENARRLRASVRFGKGEQASEVFNDVVDGIRQNISVGYRVDKKVEREDDPEDYYRVATTPMEISIVSIPADQSSLVGVGRSSSETLKSTIQIKEKDMSEKIDLDAVRAEAAKSASKNAKEIMTLARKHNKADLGEDALSRGIDISEFRGELLDVIGNDKPLDTPVTVIEQSAKEKRTYSLGRMIQAQVTGDWKDAGYERELSEEITKRTGKQSQGMYVPDFAWRSGVMTTAATGAIGSENVTDQFVPTIQRGDLFIEALRAKQVMANLGVTYMGGLTNRIRMPKIATGAAAGFVEEAGDVSDQSPTDAGVTLQPRTLGAFATMSRLLMLESVPAIEQIVQDDLLRSIADKIEYYAINGSGSSGQPTGILNDGSVNNLDISAGTDVAALTWADITDLVKLVEEDNGVVNAATLGFLTNPKVKAKMANTVKVGSTDSVMLLNDPWNAIYGYKAEFTNNVPSDLDPGDGGSDASAMIFGDFSQLMVGLFGAPSIIVDPYSGSKSGDVQISVMQEVDVALRNAISFAKTDEISTA